MTDLGICDHCDQPAIVVVNGGRACTDHLDGMFSERLTPFRESLKKHFQQEGGAG